MSKKYKKFNCELNKLKACTIYEGTMSVHFYNLNDEIFEWLHDNEIEYEYIKQMATPIMKKPKITFYYYKDLIAFKMMFSEVIQ